NVCVSKIAKRLATDSLDDRAEQVIPTIIVLEFGLRREVQSTLSRKRRCYCIVHTDAIFMRHTQPQQSEGITQPARMGEQVFDGDRLLGISPLRDELFHLVVQRELAALGEKQDGYGSELLGNRCRGKDGGRGDGTPNSRFAMP